MGKALVVGGVIVVLALIALGAWVYYRRTTFVGDLSRKEEAELRWVTRRQRGLVEEAAQVMLDLGSRMTLDESDVLSQRSAANVQKWFKNYSSFKESSEAKRSLGA